MRVGRPALDNTNSVFSLSTIAGRSAAHNNYQAIRTVLWAVRRSRYKIAPAEIARKP